MAIDIEKEKIRGIVRDVLREEGYAPIELLERIIRLEEGQKIIIEIMNARFELIDKRFDDVNNRFDDINNRFQMLTTFMSIGFFILGILISVLTVIFH